MHRADITLNQALLNQPLIVRAVRTVNAPKEWLHWLEDLGFFSGEHAMVLRQPLVSGGALVVRIGLSTFALHSEEAACIEVTALA